MIQDIRLTGFDFPKQPILPTDTADHFHLFYIFSGSGFLIVDSSSFPCGKNNLLLFPSLSVAIPTPGKHSTLSVLHLTFTCSSSSLRFELSQLSPVMPVSENTEKLLKEILHECISKLPFYEDLCALYLEQILLPFVIQKVREKALPSAASQLAASDSDVLSGVRIYIESHLDQELSIDQLSQISYLNPRQLNRIFQKHYKKTVTEYINDCRLAKARELLCFSSLTITEIAENLGFRSIHYFSRFFKKREGISPSQYRSQAMMPL